MIVAGFPDPIGWVTDGVEGAVTDAAGAGFAMAVQGLTTWVLDAVVWVAAGVFHFFFDVTDPNVQADWFTQGDGPYATTAAIGATLLVGFALAGICQGVLAGDVGGMIRQMALHLPVSVLGIVGLVSITQLLIALTDALARGVMERFDADVTRFIDVVGSIAAVSGGPTTGFVAFLLGLLAAIAGVILLAELVIRSALVYIVVALAPLVFAAQTWPALRGAGRKLLELLFALIVSKLVIAVALAVAAAAIAGTGSGGEVAALPTPEAFAEDPGGSTTQAAGVLLAALAAFGVAAFSPLLVTRLLPMTEAAVVAQGLRGAPLRAGQSAMSMSYSARVMGNRLGSVASGPVASGAAGGRSGILSGGSPTGGSGGGAAGAAAAAGGAAGAAGFATAAAGAATGVARRGADVMGRAATDRPRRPPPRPRGGSNSPRANADGDDGR